MFWAKLHFALQSILFLSYLVSKVSIFQGRSCVSPTLTQYIDVSMIKIFRKEGFH